VTTPPRSWLAAAGAEAESDGAFADSGFEPAAPEEDLVEEVAQLRETVRRQREEIERNGELIEQLIEELRRGR
jgi:FlgN protein.